jgi:acyl-CoA synthetase (NDP forming)
MDFFFNPKAIAVVGATPNPFKGGCSILKNLITGYRGRICPVNPRYDEIEGIPCFPAVSAIPDPVDLAVVFVPAKAVPEAIEDCIRKGVPGVMIESGGFAETGPEGRVLQQAIVDMAKKAGIRLWGPNCMGLVDAVRGHAFSFLDPRALQSGFVPGNVSLVVQSGMLSAGFLVDIMTNGIMGISKVCSVGNKIDVNECDLLPWLMADPDTAVIGLYLESIPEGRRLIDLCRKSPKPIVVLKGGKSEKGAQAAMSHTASLAGNQRIIADVLAQAGVVEACDFKQMMDLCRSLAICPEKSAEAKDRIAILTFSGGAGIVSSDFLEQMDLTAAELSDATKKNLQGLFPDWMPVANPVDLWPAMEKHAATDVNIYSEALRAVLDDPGVNAVLLHIFVGNFRIKVNRFSSGFWAAGRKPCKPRSPPVNRASRCSRNYTGPWNASLPSCTGKNSLRRSSPFEIRMGHPQRLPHCSNTSKGSQARWTNMHQSSS